MKYKSIQKPEISIYSNTKDLLNSHTNEKIKSKENEKSNGPQNQELKTLNDQELNTLNYEEALLNDKRTYLQYYISLIKRKQKLIFTFYTKDD